MNREKREVEFAFFVPFVCFCERPLFPVEIGRPGPEQELTEVTEKNGERNFRSPFAPLAPVKSLCIDPNVGRPRPLSVGRLESVGRERRASRRFKTPRRWKKGSQKKDGIGWRTS